MSEIQGLVYLKDPLLNALLRENGFKVVVNWILRNVNASLSLLFLMLACSGNVPNLTL